MLATSPVVLALGLSEILHSWPSVIPAPETGNQGWSLETWRGAPLWLLWIWSTLPLAIAMVMLTIAPAVERIQPAWEEAARLSGSGSFQSWRKLIWPLIRPTAARVSAVVFSLALVEPGAPLILGLRRTLAFQIVEAAGKADPFPRTAIWAAMAGLLALVGRVMLRGWGGAPVPGFTADETADGGDRTRANQPGLFVPLIGTLALGGALLVGWLPVLGLFRIVFDLPSRSLGSEGSAAPSWTPILRKLLDPPIPQLAVNTLILGLEVAAGIVLLAWLILPGLRAGSSRSLGSRIVRPIAMMPPLLQGVGILTLPWLIGLAASSLRSSPRTRGLAARLGETAIELSPDRNPWIILVVAVTLTVGLRFLRSWQWTAESEAHDRRSCFDAALLTGVSAARARALTSWRPVRWIGRFWLVACFAATGLTPALLFTPWMDGRTISPGILSLADAPGDARLQAAMLGLIVLAANVAALVVAWITAAWPSRFDADRI